MSRIVARGILLILGQFLLHHLKLFLGDDRRHLTNGNPLLWRREPVSMTFANGSKWGVPMGGWMRPAAIEIHGPGVGWVG